MKKRIISLGLSLAMVLTSANSIFAETVKIDGQPATLPYASAAATGDGSLTYLDKDITVVTLPTGNLDFTMDPQGIVGATKVLTDDAAAQPPTLTSDALKQSAFTAALDANAGKIYGTNILSIKNEGANQVEVGVSIVASASRTDGEAAKTKFLSDPALGKVSDSDVNPAQGDPKEKDNNIALNVAYTDYNVDTLAATATTASAGTIKYVEKLSATAPTDATIETAIDPHETTPTTIENYASFNDSGAKLTFQFEEDTTYGIKSDGSGYVAGIKGLTDTELAYTGPKTKGTSVGFMISGQLNKNADWSDYSGTPVETVSIKAIYDVKKLAAGTVGAGAKGTLAALSTISGASISNPSVADLSADIDLTFTPSVMDAGVTLDSAVAPTINGTAIIIGRYNTAADYYVFNGNTLTMKPLAFTTVGATGTCTVEVKDTKGNPYTSTITVTP